MLGSLELTLPAARRRQNPGPPLVGRYLPPRADELNRDLHVPACPLGAQRKRKLQDPVLSDPMLNHDSVHDFPLTKSEAHVNCLLFSFLVPATGFEPLRA